VSSYAIDHLRRADAVRALGEVHRVLRPGGEFLLEVVHVDRYGHTAFPIIAAHGFFGPNATESGWRDLLEQARFDIVESGHAPGTVYVLARKPT